jgi:hypothetical protein
VAKQLETMTATTAQGRLQMQKGPSRINQAAPINKVGPLIERLVAPPRMLPGEDPEAFEALRRALLLDLAPRSPYEKQLAEDLVQLVLEAQRHRSMRDALIWAAARDLAIGVFHSGKIRPTYNASDEATALGTALMSARPSDQTEAAVARLAQLNVTVGEILAKAYSEVSEQLEVHERKLADLERRRQRLKEEYDRLKALRRPPVEEAELVE